MPTYAYACSSCQHRLEVHQSFTDDALTDCPECGGRLRKQFGSVGVVFKGSGFYRTDSRSSATTGSAGKASGEAATAGAGSAKNGSGSGNTPGGSASSGAGSSSGSGSSSGGSSSGGSGSSTSSSSPAA